MKNLLQMLLMFIVSVSAMASPTDVIVPNGAVSYSLGNTPYMQSFTATASNVVAGPEMRDTVSIFGSYNSLFPSQSPLNLTVKLYEGEGNKGLLLDSTNLVLTSDNATVTTHFADVNYYAKGIILVVGKVYTLEWVTPDVMFNGMNSVNWWNSTLNTNVVGGVGDCYLYNATAVSGGMAGGTWKTVSQALPTDNLIVGYGPFTAGGYALGNPGRDQTGTGVSVITNNDAGCLNGQPVIGDFAIHVIDQTPAAIVPVLPSCSGSGVITQSINVSKLFFVAGGNKVAYSNVYGKPGTTVFTYLDNTGAFTLGDTASWSGVLDASGICVPDLITFSATPVLPVATPTPTPVPVATPVPTPTPAPVKAPSCVKPAGAKSFTTHAKITATGAGTLTIGTKLVTVPSCAKVVYKGDANTFGLGYDADVKAGYSLNGINYGTSLIVDDGK